MQKSFVRLAGLSLSVMALALLFQNCGDFSSVNLTTNQGKVGGTGVTPKGFQTNLQGLTAMLGTWTPKDEGMHVARTADSVIGSALTISDVKLSADVKILSGNAAAILVRANPSTYTFYALALNVAQGRIDLYKSTNGTRNTLGTAAVSLQINTIYNLQIVAVGSQLTIYLNGALVGSAVDGTITNGNLALYASDAEVLFQNVFYEAATGTGPGPTATPAPTATPHPGIALYNTNCQVCHGNIATTNRRGKTLAQLNTAIQNNAGNMGSLSGLSAADRASIMSAINQ